MPLLRTPRRVPVSGVESRRRLVRDGSLAQTPYKCNDHHFSPQEQGSGDQRRDREHGYRKVGPVSLPAVRLDRRLPVYLQGHQVIGQGACVRACVCDKVFIHG